MGLMVFAILVGLIISILLAVQATASKSSNLSSVVNPKPGLLTKMRMQKIQLPTLRLRRSGLDMSSRTVKDLRAMAKARGLKGVSQLRKVDLIAVLENDKTRT